MHERFNLSVENIYSDNDIALIKLSTPVKFGPKIAPICLPTREEMISKTDCQVIGWGRTATRNFFFLKTWKYWFSNNLHSKRCQHFRRTQSCGFKFAILPRMSQDLGQRQIWRTESVCRIQEPQDLPRRLGRTTAMSKWRWPVGGAGNHLVWWCRLRRFHTLGVY